MTLSRTATVWSFETLMDTIASCQSYREFYTRYTTAYAFAKDRGWLPALIQHCGWAMINDAVVDDPALAVVPLEQLLEDDGCLLMGAFDDPNWPVETGVGAEGSNNHLFIIMVDILSHNVTNTTTTITQRITI